MTTNNQKRILVNLPRWGILLIELPWIEILGELWKISRKMMRGLSNEGTYEVLDYETTLELLDHKGKQASLKKREKVRYLQNHILAYQDQAWGDGKILQDYRCTPGKPVDRYRTGYKTHILISRREVKNKGDIDEFNIQWNIRQGFLKIHCYWATEINHRTKKVNVNVYFPKSRPPKRTWIVEKNLQRSKSLVENSIKQLPDGRWIVSWKKVKPRLYEQYILNWEW